MIEDGTFAGEGLTFLESFTYFVIAPTVLFCGDLIFCLHHRQRGA